MKKKLINIFTNGSQFSLETQADLTKKLVDRGYTVTREYSQDAELIICIGGDGISAGNRPFLQLSRMPHHRYQYRTSGIFPGTFT